jgi:alkanesulfonate monooxygenase SsuD/methylene tetrahydromethanopterin reductase-like flavin-dependent oxidoreductase (luciferase family)
MHVMYFTEQPMSAYPADIGLEFGATALMFSNKYRPGRRQPLCNEYLEQLQAEEMGSQASCSTSTTTRRSAAGEVQHLASILAAVTKKAKIVYSATRCPGREPGRLAEELAMIDMISKGRLVSGFVRGGGQEQLANGVNPAYNRERFEEAHDLVVAAWTRQGPFRWEGTHYQHRVVNPWAVPLQKPYPRVWIPGVLSKETIVWAAKQRYPYIALNTSIEATKNIWKIYDQVAEETGYTAGPENRGYLQQVHVSDSEEKAEKNARQFLWMQGEFTGLAHPVWSAPAGYFSPEHRRQFVEFAVGRAESPRGRPTFETQVADGRVLYGTPKTVIPKLRRVLEETRPSIYGLWGNDGSVSNEDARTCIRLLGQEVMPAMREIGKELGLTDPFEANAPLHLRYSTDLTLMPQAPE